MLTFDQMVLFALAFSLVFSLIYSYNYILLFAASFRYLRRLSGLRGQSRLDSEDLPLISVVIASYNEKYVIERAIDSCAALDYPKEKLQLIVADDSDDETKDLTLEASRRLSLKGYDIRVIHREGRVGFKAGALKNSLKYCRGKFILYLDSDCIPPKDVLRRALPFFEDEGVGFVAFRLGHLNRRYNLVTESYALSTDIHHMVEQTGRFSLGLVFSFNGGAVLLRRRVEDFGDWQTDTLTEDLDLSFRIFLSGWKGVYARDIVVLAEDLPTLGSWKVQSSRCLTGFTQCMKKHLWAVLRSNLGPLQKIQATLQLINPLTNITWLLTFAFSIQTALLGLNLSTAIFAHPVFQIFTTLPLFLTVGSYLFILTRQGYSKGRLSYALLPLILGANLLVVNFLGTLRGLLGGSHVFHRTPKYGIVGEGGSWKKKYRVPLTSNSVVEIIFLGLAIPALALAILRGNYFLGLMLFSFSSILVASLYMR